LVPVTVRLNGAEPATAEVALKAEIVGLLMVKERTAETAPPGFLTLTFTVPAAAICAVVTGALRQVALT